ncbi:hypothetical protein BH23DEI1_BH23DEI1_23090 [soil metagenome]
MPRIITSTCLAALIAVLAACAPAASESPRLEVTQLAEPISFYPQQTGARWEYIRDGSTLDGVRYIEMIEGPAVIDGDIWIVSHLVGGGQDVLTYRQYRPDGVFLKRQIRPGATITFDPPMREYPAPAELRVGLTWRGDTTANGRFPSAAPDLRVQSWSVEYVYTVVDRRQVSVGGRSFEVFVIDRTVRQYDTAGAIAEELSRTTWFAPNVGVVRHENDWFLVDTNFGAGDVVQ